MHHNDLLVLLAVWLMAVFTLACIWLTRTEDTLKKKETFVTVKQMLLHF